MRKEVILLLVGLLFLPFVNAFEFNGTVYDYLGTPINNTLINITIWNMSGGPPTFVGFNSTTSNETGWFNVTVTGDASWFYKPVITHTNVSTGAVDYMGQSLPQFPYQEFSSLGTTNFYLKQAGTINITAVNQTGDRVVFQYMIKDSLLGYPIAENFAANSFVSEAIVYVPADRNYSIMIFPNMSLPVSFNWNNFTGTSDYNPDNLSYYNATTKVLRKQFNTSMQLIRVSGYINRSGISGWDEFTVVPYLLEPGNMLYMTYGAMPFNMSAWNNTMPGDVGNITDVYNLTGISGGLGFYNITLPGPAETQTILLFASARNGSNFYGGFKNISISYGGGWAQYNFTQMYGLLGDYPTNISLYKASDWSQRKNVSVKKVAFSLVNSTNNAILSMNAHIEVTVDYSDYGAMEFTFMDDISSSSNATFYIPLLNVTGVKEINVYSQSFAPKSVAKRTAAQIAANPNITMATFNPGDIDGANIISNLYITMYKSNSTCDVPNPDTACELTSSTNMGSFNPLSAVISGGKISFRMGLTASGIMVHYVNVDMLASGPPDALFDDGATTSTSGGFDSAMRFGSNGPKIYDYVLVSMPYTEGSTSTTGLNENLDVNMSIPLLYDENWNVIWNTTANGTNATKLSSNFSHYTGRSTEWQTLLTPQNCTRTVNNFNMTSPCYIDTGANRIWIRLPHFSGTGLDIDGGVVTATATSTSSSTSSSSSGGGNTGPVSTTGVGSAKTIWTTLSEGTAATVTGNEGLGITKVEFNAAKTAYGAWLEVKKRDVLPVTIKEPGIKIYKYIELKTSPTLKEDVVSEAIVTFKVAKSWLTENGLGKENIALHRFADDKWNELKTTLGEEEGDYITFSAETPGFSYFAIGEGSAKVESQLEQKEEAVTQGEAAAQEPKVQEEVPVEEKSYIWVWVLLAFVVIAAAGYFVYQRIRKD